MIRQNPGIAVAGRTAIAALDRDRILISVYLRISLTEKIRPVWE